MILYFNLLCLQSSADFSLFNVQYYITMLEDQVEYNFPFTRIKQVEKSLNEMADGEAAQEEEKKTEEIKEDEEEEKKAATGDDMLKQLQKKGKKIDLESIEEGDLGQSAQ